MKIVVATFNPGKLRELREILDLPGVEWVSLGEFPGTRAPEETGATLEENAWVKAEAASRRTGLPAVADDTGLEVDALGGAPGVHSARYAGAGAGDDANVRKLLEAMRDVEPARRSARFRTVCAACLPGGSRPLGVGVLEGRITFVPRGSGGFGYDPVFEIGGLGRTLAELGAAEKNSISHRAMAARDLAPRLAASMRDLGETKGDS